MTPTPRDYSLIGRDADLAMENGLAAAQWYSIDIPRKDLKALMKRTDGPATRDTLLWLGLMIFSGTLGVLTWGTWWALPCFLVYGVLYGSAGDSRWHEHGHGTAFKTDWKNEAVYQLASFMMLREPTVWRWSHTRHHTDTIIVGRDPEIAAMRPAQLWALASNIFMLKATRGALVKIFTHAQGRLQPDEKTYIPEMERASVYRTARIWAVLLLGVVVLCISTWSILPAMLIGLPTMYGGFMALYFGLTQHAGLAEDVLDHRLNTRTVYMNPVFRFLYLNMNYHIEHHMFPMVPYHALPALHEKIKNQCPAPYPSSVAAYAEILPALWRQRNDTGHYVRRALPEGETPVAMNHGAVIQPAE